MSLQLDNPAELRQGLDSIFNASSTSGWVLLNYVGPSTVHFASAGDEGPDQMMQYLADDAIQYGLIRIGRIQQKSGLKVVNRDVFVTFIGPEVSAAEKSDKSGFLSDAQSLLQPFQASITVLDKYKFSRDNIIDSSDPLGSHVIG